MMTLWAFAWLLSAGVPPLLQTLETAPCDVNRSRTLQQAGQQAFDNKQFSSAAAKFQEAFDACPQQHPLLLKVSVANLRQRAFEAGIRAAQKYVELTPGSTLGTLALANAYFMAQRLPEALREAKAILIAEPELAAALELKGNIEYLTGHLDDSLRTFIELLEHHPDDEEGAYMLGRIYYQEGRIEQATGQFQRVLKVNPKSYKALDNLGLCYEAQGDTEMATRYFLTAIKLAEDEHSDYDWAYANLAKLLLDERGGEADLERAFAAASKAADRNPYSARNFYLGGKALAELGKKDLSVNWLERSANLDPKYPEPLYLLAKVYAQLGQNDKAAAALEKFRAVKAAAPRERK
jgi:tetratricopeptide (TPR) repeat protein